MAVPVSKTALDNSDIKYSFVKHTRRAKSLFFHLITLTINYPFSSGEPIVEFVILTQLCPLSYDKIKESAVIYADISSNIRECPTTGITGNTIGYFKA